MKFPVRVCMRWLPLAVAITGMCLLVYATLQQNYRQSLNDPQIQLAEDAAFGLKGGLQPKEVVPNERVIMPVSLKPWVAVYDETGKLLASSGYDYSFQPLPEIFRSVLEATRSGNGKDTKQPNENRLSWEPRLGVRHAIVVVWVPEKKQFVVAGRNMREVEEREESLGKLVLFLWLVTMTASLAAALFARYLRDTL